MSPNRAFQVCASVIVWKDAKDPKDEKDGLVCLSDEGHWPARSFVSSAMIACLGKAPDIIGRFQAQRKNHAMDAANFRFDTPQGPLYGYLTNEGLRELRLPVPDHPIQPYMLHSRPNHMLGRRLMHLFADYFAGVAVDFGEVPLDPSFGTPFQRAVWEAARDVSHGHTTTYGKLAARIGSPGAARAVGSALGENPLCIVVPCHRVLAANGRLGGFSAGLDWKRCLLRLEGIGDWKE